MISGPTAAIDAACAAAKDAGAKRALKLDVSAAFHSSGMGPAQEAMAAALADAAVSAPAKPVVANVDQTLVTDPADVRRTLTEQVTGRVRWQDCIRVLSEQGAETFLEVGAGKVLTGMMKKIDSSKATGNFGETKELEAAKEKLG